MDKKALAKKIIATVQDDDLDMHNKFLPRPLLDEMADAASGAYEIMPRRTLRERQYQQKPLMIRPDYGQNFLKKLEQPFEGKSQTEDILAADEENLKDFSMPSEMLKHQEEPHPRVLIDDFIEYSGRPGPGAGGDDLSEYWDRGWEDTDSPEMSEDKWNRMWTIPGEYNRMARNIVATSLVGNTMAGRVIAGFLLNRAPKASGGIRTAKLMNELFKKSSIHGKKPLKNRISDVTVNKKAYLPGVGRFVFLTNSPKEVKKSAPGVFVNQNEEKTTTPYTTTLEFIPEGNIKDPSRLHVRVSCTCPSWLYWGAQYHAYLEKYLYGPIQPVFAAPVKRDPEGSFLACKHILACIAFIEKQRLRSDKLFNVGIGKVEPMAPEFKKFKKEDPRRKYIEIQEREPIRIPERLEYVEKKPYMKEIMDAWEKAPASGNARRNVLLRLTDPDDVTFMGFKYPSTATVYVAERLKNIAIKAINAGDTTTLNESKEDIKDLDKATHGSSLVRDDVKMPPELMKFDKDRAIQKTIKNFDQYDYTKKFLVLKDIPDPDALGYIAHKFWLDDVLVSDVVECLNKIRGSSKSDEDKEKVDRWLGDIPKLPKQVKTADKWLKVILGG